MNEKPPNIAIIGLGLIGSSIALAAKQACAAANIVGFDNSAEVRSEAKQIGLPVELVDDIKRAVVDADIVFGGACGRHGRGCTADNLAFEIRGYINRYWVNKAVCYG